jgi:hypothetical protein
MKKSIIFIISLAICFVNSLSFAKDRCIDHLPTIRMYSLQYLGLDYPYWYNVGCAQAESSCRSDIISFDGGIGLFQLTPSTGITKEISKYISIDPYNSESNIRAQSYYLSRIVNNHFKSGPKTIGNSKYPFNPQEHIDTCGLHLADVYRFYNSGYWFFAESKLNYGPRITPFDDYRYVYWLTFSEILNKTKMVCSNNEMAVRSVRAGTCVGGKYLSFPQVSYSYPVKIWNYAQPYKGISDGQWSFWYIESDKKLTAVFPLRDCK